MESSIIKIQRFIRKSFLNRIAKKSLDSKGKKKKKGSQVKRGAKGKISATGLDKKAN